MKNYFKKFSIMFLMAFAILLGCSTSVFASDDGGVLGVSNLNNTAENSAKIGDALKLPEIGWKRYDDTESNITYVGNEWIHGDFDNIIAYKSTASYTNTGNTNSYVKFKFRGTKLRIIATKDYLCDRQVPITIDNVNYNCNEYSGGIERQILIFEINNLNDVIHEVQIKNGQSQINLDAIDIDKNGYLVDSNQSISLDKSSMNLTVGNSKQLTATTTPAGAEIEWSSDNPEIATVDSNGKVVAEGEGTCTITAKIKGSDIKATCIVTVTKEPKPSVDEPEEPTGDGSLYIEMVDGNIKRDNKNQVEKFKNWFLGRDLDKTENPIFKITNAKGNTEYLVHDKIVGFEIR